MSNESISRRTFVKMSATASAATLLSSNQFFMPNQILHRTIPATGEKIPAIGLGSWLTFDVGSSTAERAPMREVLKNFLDLGGKVVDSSPMYGRSEQVIGELAAELKITENLWVSTKVWTNGEGNGKQQIADSTRLFKRQPDVLHVHNLLDFKTHVKTLRSLKDEGKIRYVGVTHYLVSAHEEVARLLKTEPLDFIQINFSIQTRAAENYLLPLAAEKGVAVIINRPFEQGALFDKVQGKALPTWANEWNMTTWAAFFLKYILSNPNVTCAIPATTKVHHLRENMAAGLGKLPDEETRKRMVQIFEK